MVKALDLKSNGVSLRRFEPCSQRFFFFFLKRGAIINTEAKYIKSFIFCNSCDGGVVKALDSKSNGVSPRRFESCRLRDYFVPAEETTPKRLTKYASCED